MKSFLFTFGLFLSIVGWTQFAPAVGQPGTSAISKDSAIFTNWGHQVINFQPGLEYIGGSSTTLANFGTASNALGVAEGNNTQVVSLGDGGSIVIKFQYPVINGLGPDFAIFENSFSNTFLELAHVEVSTDGIHFVRFPSQSLTQTNTQLGPFGSVQATQIYNLAGKYKQGYGTPFDLEDISDSTNINLDSIHFVKIIDVVGSIQQNYASYDHLGNMINDPYPTEFASCGFDLDGIGVIHENRAASIIETNTLSFNVFPNPANSFIQIDFKSDQFDIDIYNISGTLVKSLKDTKYIQTENLATGIYFLRVSNQQGSGLQKIMITH